MSGRLTHKFWLGLSFALLTALVPIAICLIAKVLINVVL